MFFGACVMTFGLPLIIAIPATLAFAAFVGMINGQIVIRTGLPSFIVTLAFPLHLSRAFPGRPEMGHRRLHPASRRT